MTNKTKNYWVITPQEEGARLITYLRDKLNSSNADIRWSIEHQRCLVNGEVELFSSRRLSASDRVHFHFDKKPQFSFEKSRVLFEDEWLIAYDKPFYLPMVGEVSVQSLLSYSPVHRLDRDTTGVLLLAKNEKIQKEIVSLFRMRKINKSYLALVSGIPTKESGVIDNYMGELSRKEGEITMGIVSASRGERAITSWTKIATGTNASLLRVLPRTGRTHQIRVHLSHIRHPILGDVRYGSRRSTHGFYPLRTLLHAESLSFQHPITKAPLTLRAPPPPEFLEALSSHRIEFIL